MQTAVEFNVKRKSIIRRLDTLLNGTFHPADPLNDMLNEKGRIKVDAPYPH